MVFLTRHGPADGERSGADLGELQVGGWGDGWGRGNDGGETLAIGDVYVDRSISYSCFHTCSLCPLQWGAGCVIMQGNDLDGVFGSGLQAVDYRRLGVSSWRRQQLSFAFLWARIQNPVGCDDALRAVPRELHGGGIDFREGEVLGVVHIWR